MERMAEFTTSINFIAIYVESWKKFFDYKGRILRERERERESFSPSLAFISLQRYLFRVQGSFEILWTKRRNRCLPDKTNEFSSDAEEAGYTFSFGARWNVFGTQTFPFSRWILVSCSGCCSLGFFLFFFLPDRRKSRGIRITYSGSLYADHGLWVSHVQHGITSVHKVKAARVLQTVEANRTAVNPC